MSTKNIIGAHSCWGYWQATKCIITPFISILLSTFHIFLSRSNQSATNRLPIHSPYNRQLLQDFLCQYRLILNYCTYFILGIHSLTMNQIMNERTNNGRRILVVVADLIPVRNKHNIPTLFFFTFNW